MGNFVDFLNFFYRGMDLDKCGDLRWFGTKSRCPGLSPGRSRLGASILRANGGVTFYEF